MPYITQSARYPLDAGLRAPDNAGELNYLLTTYLIDHVNDVALQRAGLLAIVMRYLALKGKRYVYINDIIGALTCAKLEFARRTGMRRFDSQFDEIVADFYHDKAAPYEDEKITENGDVYPARLLQSGPVLTDMGLH